VGLDYSARLLTENPHKRLIRGDATALPFKDGSFDLVFEANLPHHVPRRQTAICETARVSRRHVVLLEPNRYNPLMFGCGLAVREESGLLGFLRRFNRPIWRGEYIIVAGEKQVG
jgi:ubiquinone/menaquinone biosynthesis C-methylase UbiE